MLTAVQAYYDGKQVVMDEQDRAYLNAGDRLVITVLNNATSAVPSALAEKRLRMLEEERHVRPSGRSVEEIDRYIAELRDEDRI